MVLLASALEQRLVRRLLDQGMLEGVRGAGWYAARVKEFGVDQSAQRGLQRRLIQGSHVPEQVVGEHSADGGPELRDRLGSAQAIQACRERIAQRGRNPEGRRRCVDHMTVLTLLEPT